MSSITVAREESERLRKDEGEGKKKKKREEGEGINNRFILEAGAGATAPFRPKESLVFWVEEEVQSYLVLEEVHRTFERVFNTKRGRESTHPEKGRTHHSEARTGAATSLRRKKIIFQERGKVQPHP